MRLGWFVLVGLALLAGACVYPVPPPGESVPTITFTDVSRSSADQTVTVSGEVSVIEPTYLQLWPAGFSGAPGEIVTSSPFTFTFDVSQFAPGTHQLVVLAKDGATIVTASLDYSVVGCNRHVALCSRSYSDVAYATTHNAMSNDADGWTGPNQTDTIATQLADGTRALMIDTYRAGADNGLGGPQVPNVDPDASYLCHAFCFLGSRPLVDGLSDVRAFLDANPGEIVTLIVESYLSHDLTGDALTAAGLDSQLVAHQPGQPWPTLGELVDANTRLVVLSDRPADPNHPGQLYVWNEAFETPFSNAVPGDFSCQVNRGQAGNELFILNHFLTEVFGSPALADQVNHNPVLYNRAVACGQVHDRIANFVTVDFIDIGDTYRAVDQLNGVATPVP